MRFTLAGTVITTVVAMLCTEPAPVKAQEECINCQACEVGNPPREGHKTSTTGTKEHNDLGDDPHACWPNAEPDEEPGEPKNCDTIHGHCEPNAQYAMVLRDLNQLRLAAQSGDAVGIAVAVVNAPGVVRIVAERSAIQVVSPCGQFVVAHYKLTPSVVAQLTHTVAFLTVARAVVVQL